MATITISNLSPVGLNLFLGSENYLDELSGDDLTKVNGGILPLTPGLYASLILSAGSAVGSAIVSGAVGYFGRK